VWQSIFTHDLRRYQRTLYSRMGDFATLITGPSGTGKELVAQALAKSRYVPFDDKRLVLDEPKEDTFYPINLPALSPTLIESELFGHQRGAFTGAVRDRRGRLEICPSLGTVFLDEIGDLDPLLQVKLLRVIETRTFQAVGDDADRRFDGKLVAATNRDLSLAIREGRFREDLYFRLCSDQIRMPSLNGVLQETPAALSELILFMARKVLGENGPDDGTELRESESLAQEVEDWVTNELGPDYRWPGNYRELEQCVRNILIHKEYRPLPLELPYSHQAFFTEITSGKLSADELLRWYCTIVYSLTGSYAETARRLNLDRRTVKSKIEPQLLDQLCGEE
jgi:transcriptional regulator with GAF, ATPase, and Fis domain